MCESLIGGLNEGCETILSNLILALSLLEARKLKTLLEIDCLLTQSYLAATADVLLHEVALKSIFPVHRTYSLSPC